MIDKKVKILDTNVLLDYPQIITKTDEYWIIPTCVLEEIDGLKKHRSPEIAQKARKAAVYISKNMDNIEFYTYIGIDNNETVDQKLMNITEERNGVLVTNDVALKVFCIIKEIETEGYSWDEDYIGSITLNVDNLNIDEYNEIVGTLRQDGKLIDNSLQDYEFSENEFLIVPPYHDASLGKESIFKFIDGKFIPITAKAIKNNQVGSVYPRNPEQICLADALLSNIPIVYVGGKFGTGKTYLTHNYAIRELESERIKKIVYIPNNAYTQNTMELGALPGC